MVYRRTVGTPTHRSSSSGSSPEKLDPPKKTTIDPMAIELALARLKTFREGDAPLAVTAPTKAGITAAARKPKSTTVVVKTAVKEKIPKARKTKKLWKMQTKSNSLLKTRGLSSIIRQSVISSKGV